MAIDYASKIPNNVGLGSNRALQRALEHWQPRYLDWWREAGPVDAEASQVYLRTAVSVETGGWAHFDYVKMPDYRWGIFLAPPESGRQVGFGQHLGEAAWNEVPGEYRATLRRIIVTQGDTEPASVEQQRWLGRTCPSLYDLRNLYQVNVEEGRHLWAMVYLLHAHFGRDGREEAEWLLERRSGDTDRPRILGAFNEPTPDWLSFFMFTFLTDRDGKYQLAALAESGFDPLARSCQFMLTEEAHHLFVGESGIARTIKRTAEVMKANGVEAPDQVRALGVIDLPTIQRYLNQHFSVTLDLYGSEESTNACTFYNLGLKGRFEERKLDDDHRLDHDSYPVPRLDERGVHLEQVPAQLALNERLRDDYIADVQLGIDRFNKLLQREGLAFRFKLPDKGFHRQIGTFAGQHLSPDGTRLTQAQWEGWRHRWLPSQSDRDFVASLMQRVTEPGTFAGWIAPPARGIHSQPVDFEYVRL